MEHGFSTNANVVRVIDGDTIEVELVRRFNIRLRGIDAPELDTDQGKLVKLFVITLLEKAKDDITIFIPSNNPEKLMDINSFNRLVGDIYIGDVLLQHLIQDFIDKMVR